MTSNPGSAIQQVHLTHPKYRPDIDGLRAIAILSVVIYHAFPKLIKGGFIGVDIFFVISGFLISTIIFSSMERNSFSFIEFYSRRIKRIFPALTLVLIACLSFGWIALIADEYKQLGKHVAGGAGFISNFLFWNESGYFDNASETKPLLHLWSLGIEEQFYIFWPLLLWLGWKIRSNLLATAIVIAVASFALNVGKVQTDAVAAFYSPLTRFWELLAGSILAYVTLHRENQLAKLRHRFDMWLGRLTAFADKKSINDIQSLLGAILIFAGIFIVNAERQFPGWWALLPVTGAVMIISSGVHSWFNRTVLSNRVLVWLGLISYPLYLWHWPLLSFAWIVESNDPSRQMRIVAVTASIILAWLTYRFIEKPMRFGKHGGVKSAIMVGMMAILAAAGYKLYELNGLPSRAVAQLQSKSIGDIGHDEYDRYNIDHFYPCDPVPAGKLSPIETKKKYGCRQSKKSRAVDLAIIGDSHADHLFIGLAEGLPAINVATYTYGGLPFLKNKGFDDIFKTVIEDDNIKTIILSAYWGNRITRVQDGIDFPSEFIKTIDTLIKANKRVYLAEDVPDFPFDPKKCKYSRRFSQANGCVQNRSTFEKRHMKYYPFFESIEGNNHKVKILKTSIYFCDADTCTMAKDGHLFYRDKNHLNITGSKYLGLKIRDDLINQK